MRRSRGVVNLKSTPIVLNTGPCMLGGLCTTILTGTGCVISESPIKKNMRRWVDWYLERVADGYIVTQESLDDK